MKRSQRPSGVSLWNRFFPYIGIGLLVFGNFYFIRNLQVNHEGEHQESLREQLAIRSAELERQYKEQYQQEFDLLQEKSKKLDEQLVELEIEKLAMLAGSMDDPDSLSNEYLLELDIARVIERLSSNSEKNKDLILDLSSKWLDAKIEQVQNPKDCQNVKWHYCTVFNNCGGGCVIHQLAYCFLVGFAMNRTTILGDGFRYLQDFESDQWEAAYEPMTRTCEPPIRKFPGGGIVTINTGDHIDEKITSLDFFSRGEGSNFIKWAASDGFHTNTPFYLPKEIEGIRNLHGDIRVWIVGHLERYMLRLNPKTAKALALRNEPVQENYEHPVVGIHVRRTDHSREAPFRDLKDYLKFAREWFEEKGIAEGERRIYLATDEPEVIKEAKREHPQYKWLVYEYEGTVSGHVGGLLDSDRPKKDGFFSLMSDWHWLSHADYIVGTSSSQVTRMAYELMQNYHPNAAKSFTSLDDPWYFP